MGGRSVAGRNGPIGLGVLAGTPALEARERLDPGDLLLMFSDGLIERRGESIDAGYDRLQELLADASSAAPLIDRILERATSTDDDLTLLAVERAPG